LSAGTLHADIVLEGKISKRLCTAGDKNYGADYVR